MDIKLMLDSMKKAQDAYGKIPEYITSIAKDFPKIDMPNIYSSILDNKKIKIYPDSKMILEDNNWQRHKEILDIQTSVLKIQKDILKEQKTTSKVTFWILGLTIVSIIFQILFL